MARWLTGAIDRLRLEELALPDKNRRRQDNEEALDHILELGVAGRLARVGLDVALIEPPDIVVDVGDEDEKARLGIAHLLPRPHGVRRLSLRYE
jgi:hypothetical protein